MGTITPHGFFKVCATHVFLQRELPVFCKQPVVVCRPATGNGMGWQASGCLHTSDRQTITVKAAKVRSGHRLRFFGLLNKC